MKMTVNLKSVYDEHTKKLIFRHVYNEIGTKELIDIALKRREILNVQVRSYLEDLVATPVATNLKDESIEEIRDCLKSSNI